MPITGSPKKMAQDIANGYLNLSPATLKSYTPADMKTVLQNIALVSRELRAEKIPQDDVMAIKFRNMKLSRLRQAEVVIRAHCRKKRIPV
ncbi:MAG: hypothetical protein GWN87_04015 [Desulfuromonadales bacterium]|nr:hypothetical protein [Desulfuromonadales bacterium]NIS39790.1 hypothetical protein [Desulfuromonadales bacterium]